MVYIGRRDFFRASSCGLASLALHQVLGTRKLFASSPLEKDPQGILDLPRGFHYQIIDRFGQRMSDGFRVPGLPDGMACFADGNGQLILMRNHELGSEDWARAAYPADRIPKEAYRQKMTGGVSRVVLRQSDLRVVSSNMVLTGTSRNCAGGSSPWGWLSCEEDFREGHGYTFLCNPLAESLEQANVIKSYGRFNHEAVCIEPTRYAAYLTEDRSDGVLYRFLPDRKEQPFVGRLQALVLREQKQLKTANGWEIGDEWDGYWVDLKEPDPKNDTLRYEAHGLGAAIFARGEGIWRNESSIYVVSTSGGPIGRGQVFKLEDNLETGQARLRLMCQSHQAAALDCPDNITVSPQGDVYVAEDGSGEQYIRMIDEGGQVYNFARNAISQSEMAGVCFDPSGQHMFLNIQKEGLTLAISGPFHQFKQMATAQRN
ncbi:MAG: alkaline phosphatase PhoX [Oligoflexus sp.]